MKLVSTGKKQINQAIARKSECQIKSGQREDNNCVLEQKLDKDAVCHRSYSNYTANTLPRRLLKGVGYFKLGVKLIRTVEYADGLVRMAKEETVLQDIFDSLMKIKRFYIMEINVERGSVMRISTQPPPTRNIIDQV
jgi:hypothetical protein